MKIYSYERMERKRVNYINSLLFEMRERHKAMTIDVLFQVPCVHLFILE